MLLGKLGRKEVIVSDLQPLQASETSVLSASQTLHLVKGGDPISRAGLILRRVRRHTLKCLLFFLRGIVCVYTYSNQ